MTVYQNCVTSQEACFFDLRTEAPFAAGTAQKNLYRSLLRESTDAQKENHVPKDAYLEAVARQIGFHTILKSKTFIGSARATPLHEYLATGDRSKIEGTWFEDFVNVVKVDRKALFPGCSLTYGFLTPDRVVRESYFHPHNSASWHITSQTIDAVYRLLELEIGSERMKAIRLVTAFRGTPKQCRGFQAKLSQHYNRNTIRDA